MNVCRYQWQKQEDLRVHLNQKRENEHQKQKMNERSKWKAKEHLFAKRKWGLSKRKPSLLHVYAHIDIGILMAKHAFVPR